YQKDKERTVLKLDSQLAPYKVAVFPLVANKEELIQEAQHTYRALKSKVPTYWDDRGNIGKRYKYQDEVGTPYCITIDYQTLEDKSVTIRDRDTTQQERIPLEKVVHYVLEKMSILY